MGFSQFFITRPIFASVLSIFIALVGALAGLTLPIAQYPDIVPPTVQVSAVFPGADAETVAQTVAVPLEREINGVENMLYMSSACSANGTMNLTVTFKVGTDLDTAQVLVQNRVAIAEAALPEEVRRQGVRVLKKSPDMMLLINLVSPDGRYDANFLDNYMLLQVRDVIARVPGVGDASAFGSEYAMRVWLDPDKLQTMGLTVEEVIGAIREQNVVVAAGAVGKEPAPQGTERELTVSTQGRLQTPEQFADIIVKRGARGESVRLSAVARLETGAKEYTMSTKVDGMNAATLAVFQAPGSNALSTAEAVHRTMDELAKAFPEGIEYRIVYDTTTFVEESVATVLHTLIEAAILVVLVVLLFLQNWRSTLIPMLAVPVSLLGTFAVMQLMGFTLNNLTLFGLVLAIGIVVDDAIVVIEAVELKMSQGMSALAATQEAMREVSGALVAIAIVLTVVFLPTAFIPGISGLFYQQFAVTIAVATIISAFNSLTLSPALCALLLKPHGAKRDPLEWLIHWTLGWFFHLFNKAFDLGTAWYAKTVRILCRGAFLVLIVYGGLLFATAWGFRQVPAGFVPEQDKGALMILALLPEASSKQRTNAFAEQLNEAIKTHPGVKHTVSIQGYSLLTGGAMTNAASIFVILDDFQDRKDPTKSANAILRQLHGQLRNAPEGLVMIFGPPPVNGLGATGGYKLLVQDTLGQGTTALEGAMRALVSSLTAQSEIQSASSTFRSDTPRLFVDIDREKAKSMGVSLASVSMTLQTLLGSAYVNDVTLFGRSYQVKAQAEPEFRQNREDLLRPRVRNAVGEMVPLGAFVTVSDRTGPATVTRFNSLASADVTITPAAGVSSGAAMALAQQLAQDTLPTGFTISWTDIAFQELAAGNVALLIFPLSVLFVFLVLSAQYESWSLPLAIILIVPMCLLSSIMGLYARGMTNDIFVQIGFIVLVGLACKNAILIVEFAKQIMDKGLNRLDAAVEAARLRLRPILMTSAAFTMGVVPLMLGTGAGAEMRVSLGNAVFFGMLGVTIFGILLTPVFFVVILALSGKKSSSDPGTQNGSSG
jgi:multidrug efflux pump